MEAALKEACTVPVEIMERAAEGIELCKEYAKNGSKLALSDAGVGVVFCKAALRGASLNVYINTKAMKDAAYAAQINKKTAELLEKYTKLAEEVYTLVENQLSPSV
jgi:formiminotetrahydrofolate cyclodeaminase